MSEIALAGGPVEDPAARGTITEDDVLRLRREIFVDGRVGRGEADRLFRLDRACRDKAPGWTALYVEALTDVFVWQSDPVRSVAPAQADALLAQVTADGRIDSPAAIALLVNIVQQAELCPPGVPAAARTAICRRIVDPSPAERAAGRTPGVIEAEDVEQLRQLLYAGAGGGSFTITREEAEALVALNRRCDEAKSAPAWRELFVKALGSHLMLPRGAPERPDIARMAESEAWLEDRRGVAGLLTETGQSIGRFDLGEAWAALDVTGRRRREARAQRRAAELDEAAARERIDAPEAGWLLAQLGPTLSGNERALLGFIRETAREIDPTLEAAMDQAGI